MSQRFHHILRLICQQILNIYYSFYLLSVVCIEDRPGTAISGGRGEINQALSLSDDDSDTTSTTNQGAYDVLRRVSIADTHL